jgi:hypothetical protein
MAHYPYGFPEYRITRNYRHNYLLIFDLIKCGMAAKGINRVFNFKPSLDFFVYF